MGGRSIGSIDIVNYAKMKGLYVIVTDNLPIIKSPAKQLADEYWDISTNDINKLFTRIKRENVEAIFTGIHEFNISKTAELAELANLLFYATKEQIESTSKKNIYRKLFKSYNLPVTPEYNLEEKANIKFPVVVKPVDGSGSYGVAKCNNFIELDKAVKNALSISKSKEVLIEKYLNLKEITIFYTIVDGKFFLSAMADRITMKYDSNINPLPIGYIFPSKHLDSYLYKQHDRTIESFKKLDIKNGMIFIQAFVDDEKYIYYDIGYRLTGTQEYNIIEEINGFNPLKMMIDYSINGKMGNIEIDTLNDPMFKGMHACNLTFLAHPGKISAFKGIDLINMYPGIIKTVINHNIGEEINADAIGTLNQVVFRVFGVTESKESLMILIDYVIKCFDVLDDNMESILIQMDRNLL